METICNYSKLRRMNIKEERKFSKLIHLEDLED